MRRGFTLALALWAGVAMADEPGAFLAGRHAEARGDPAAAAGYLAQAAQAEDAGPALIERAALNLAAAGRIAEADAMAARLGEAAPSRLGALIRLAHALQQGRFAEAAAIDADTLPPLIGDLASGWAGFAASGLAEGESRLDAAEKRPLFRLFVEYHRGLMRLLAGDAAGAVAALAESRKLMERPTVRFTLAQASALALSGDGAAALEALEAARGRGVEDARLEAALASVASGSAPPPALADPRKGAAEAFQDIASFAASETGSLIALAHARLALALDPGLDAARITAARILIDEEQPEAAAALYDTVPPDSPLALDAALGRAAALERMDRRDAAQEALRAAARRAPEAVEPQLRLGDLFRRSDAWTDCIDAYSAALDRIAAEGREDWLALYQRGVCSERAGRWPEAEADFRRALELEPDHPLILNYLGYSWVDQGMNFEEAEEMIRRAVEARPEDGYITDSLGWVQYRRGHFEDAVATLERAVSLTATDPIINDHLGDAYWMVGRKREAEFQWKRARSFDPTPETLARIKRKLAIGLDAVRAQEQAEAAALSGDGG